MRSNNPHLQYTKVYMRTNSDRYTFLLYMYLSAKFSIICTYNYPTNVTYRLTYLFTAAEVSIAIYFSTGCCFMNVFYSSDYTKHSY